MRAVCAVAATTVSWIVQAGLGEAAFLENGARGGALGSQVLLANASGRRGGGRSWGRALQSDDGQPVCSCDCCNVAQRRPDEVVANAGIKCAPSDEHSTDLCGEQGLCSPLADDRVLRDTLEDQSVDYQRFCLFECKPAEGLASPIRTQCVALEPPEMAKVVDSMGNPIDPAIIYSHGPEQQPVADQQYMSAQGGGQIRRLLLAAGGPSNRTIVATAAAAASGAAQNSLPSPMIEASAMEVSPFADSMLGGAAGAAGVPPAGPASAALTSEGVPPPPTPASPPAAAAPTISVAVAKLGRAAAPVDKGAIPEVPSGMQVVSIGYAPLATQR